MKLETVAFDEKRLAALTLHALRAEDRAWVLERVDLNQRRELEALLLELQTLGIPSDPDLVRAALQPAPQAVAPAIAMDALRIEDSTLGRILSGESDTFAARALSLVSESRRDAVLQAMGAKQREAVIPAMSSLADAPQLDAAMIRALNARADGEVRA